MQCLRGMCSPEKLQFFFIFETGIMQLCEYMYVQIWNRWWETYLLDLRPDDTNICFLRIFYWNFAQVIKNQVFFFFLTATFLELLKFTWAFQNRSFYQEMWLCPRWKIFTLWPWLEIIGAEVQICTQTPPHKLHPKIVWKKGGGWVQPGIYDWCLS